MYVYMYACVSMSMCVFLYICTCVFVCVCLCICVGHGSTSSRPTGEEGVREQEDGGRQRIRDRLCGRSREVGHCKKTLKFRDTSGWSWFFGRMGRD